MLRYQLAAFILLAGVLCACQESQEPSTTAALICDCPTLDPMTCQDFGYPSGQLRCNDACTGFLVSGCKGMPSWVEEPPCASCAADEVCEDEQCVAAPRTDFTSEQQSFDLRKFTVSGQVELQGSDRSPDEPFPGNLVFLSLQTEFEDKARIQSDGSFSVNLFHGTYRVFWSGDQASPNMPLMSVELTESPVDVHEAVDLALQVPEPVQFTGTLAADAASTWRHEELRIRRLPDEFSTGRFGAVTHRISTTIDPNSTPSFSFLVFPGTYQVITSRYASRMFPRESGFFQSENWEPWEGIVLADAIEVGADTHRDFAPRLYALDVDVEMPEHTYLNSRSLELRQADITTSYRLDVDDEGNLSTRLPGGSYSLELMFRASPEAVLKHTERLDLDIDADTHLTLRPSIELVEVTGQVSGLPERDSPELGYEIEFRSDLYTFYSAKPIASDGSFAGIVPRGTSRVCVRTDDMSEYFCFGEVTVDEATPLHLDASAFDERVRLHGDITARGERIPDNTYSGPRGGPTYDYTRGRVRFVCIDKPGCENDFESIRLSSTGPARYDVSLRPGVAYRVELVVMTSPSGRRTPPGPSPLPSDALPGGTYVLQPRLVVEHEHRRDFDVKIVTVDGQVTASGEMLPTSAEAGFPSDRSRGEVSSTVILEARELAPDGPATYSFDFFPGYYDQKVRLSQVSSDFVTAWTRRYVRAVEDMSYELSLPLRDSQVQLTFNGAPIQASHSRAGVLTYRTPWTYLTEDVGADGTARVWWLGAEPTITFSGYYADGGDAPWSGIAHISTGTDAAR